MTRHWTRVRSPIRIHARRVRDGDKDRLATGDADEDVGIERGTRPSDAKEIIVVDSWFTVREQDGGSAADKTVRARHAISM